MSEPVKVAPRFDALPSGLYAEAGEKTYCESGHFLGRIVRDVKLGDMASPDDFKLVPGFTVGMTGCHICGGTVLAVVIAETLKTAPELSLGLSGYFFEVEAFNPEIQR